MNGRNDMTAIYSELAPQFLVFLAGKKTAIERQIAKLQSASQQSEVKAEDATEEKEAGVTRENGAEEVEELAGESSEPEDSDSDQNSDLQEVF